MKIRKISKDEKLTTITLTKEEVSRIASILQATTLEKDALYFNLQVIDTLLRNGIAKAEYEGKDPYATKETLPFKLSALRMPGDYCIYPLKVDRTKGVIIRIVEVDTIEKTKEKIYQVKKCCLNKNQTWVSCADREDYVLFGKIDDLMVSIQNTVSDLFLDIEFANTYNAIREGIERVEKKEVDAYVYSLPDNPEMKVRIKLVTGIKSGKKFGRPAFCITKSLSEDVSLEPCYVELLTKDGKLSVEAAYYAFCEELQNFQIFWHENKKQIKQYMKGIVDAKEIIEKYNNSRPQFYNY